MEDAIRGWVSLICRAQRDATTRVCARNPCVIVQTKAPDPPPYTSLNIYSNAKTFSAFHRALPARPRARGEPSIQSFNFFPAFLIHPLVEWRFILTNFSVSIRDVNFDRLFCRKRKCVILFFFFRIFYYHNISRLIQFKFGRV